MQEANGKRLTPEMLAKSLEGDLPVIMKPPALGQTTLSNASTFASLDSIGRDRFVDLSDFDDRRAPIFLPSGALDDLECDAVVQCGSAMGKFGERINAGRSISLDSCSDDGCNDGDLDVFYRMLGEAERVRMNVGVHVKVTKLTTSRSKPYKTILRKSVNN